MFTQNQPRSTPKIAYFLFIVAAAFLIAGIARLTMPEYAFYSQEAATLLTVVGLAAGVGGGVTLYDSQPIPQEYVPPPAPLDLEQGEPWRQETGFRYLEKLKKSCGEYEDAVRRAHGEAVAAHERIPASRGLIEYKNNRWTMRRQLQYASHAAQELTKLKARIAKVFSGDVRAELLDLDEQVQKLRRQRQEYEREVREVEQRTGQAATPEARRDLENQRASIYGSIKQMDMSIIEVESTITELREFDFQKLYRELGVSAESMRVEAERLASIKEKADIINAIKPPKVRPALSPEEERAQKRAECEAEVQRLRQAKKRAVDAIDPADQDVRVRTANMYDDRIIEAEERLRKHL